MKTLIVALSAGIAGLVAGAGAMLVAFPFLFPPPAADDPLPAPAAFVEKAAAEAGPANRVARAAFAEDSPGRDALHWANGHVGVYRSGERLVLRLESDFVAGPGPNFIIYLNTRPVGDESDFLADAGGGRSRACAPSAARRTTRCRQASISPASGP